MQVTRLARQKRRYIFTGLGCLLAGLIGFGVTWQAFVCGFASLACLSLVLLVQPALRNWAETITTGFLLATALPFTPEVAPSAGLVMGWLVHQLAYGRIADRLGFQFRALTEQKAHIKGSAREVWNAIIPGESHPSDVKSCELVDFDRDKDDPETCYLRLENGDSLLAEMTLTHLETKRFQRARFLIEADNDHGEQTYYTLILEENADGSTYAHLSMELTNASLGHALLHWFDDDLTFSLSAAQRASENGATARLSWGFSPN